jgi:hypothetical protein
MSCLYCGKKRGLALFKKDGFCSAEHRQLWEEREASNLIQRLNEARDGRERKSLRLPQQPSADPAAAAVSDTKIVKQLEGAPSDQAPSADVKIVVSRQPYVAPVTETPTAAPAEPKAAEFVPPESVEMQRPVARKVTRVQPVDKRLEIPRISGDNVGLPASSGNVPAGSTAAETKQDRCLYCGKKRGFGLFQWDGFCSANHRKLWQERESLVQRLIDARERSEPQPLHISKRPSIDPAPASTSPSEVLRELQASIGKHTAPPNDEIVSPPSAVEAATETAPTTAADPDEIVSPPPAVEPAMETEPTTTADPVVAGFVLATAIQLEHQTATKFRAVWTADAPLDAPRLAIFFPASSAFLPTGFAGSQTGLRIHACHAGSVANANKRLNASWPGRAPFDTAFPVESRKPGPRNSTQTAIPVQAVTLDQTTSAENPRRNLSHSDSISFRIHGVTTSSRTPELRLAIGTITPVFSNLTHPTAAVDMVPGGVWPARRLTLPIDSVAPGLTDAKFINLPKAYSRVGVSVGLSQSYRPSVPYRVFERQLVLGDYSKLPPSFIAPGASIFLAVPALAGREVNIAIEHRSRPALRGLPVISLPFQAPVTVPHRPTVSAVAALRSIALPSRTAEHKLAIAPLTAGILPRLALKASAVASDVAAVSQLRSLAISARAAEDKLAFARFTVGTLPKLTLQASSVSPAVTLNALREVGRLRSTLPCAPFVSLSAAKPAAVEATRGADARGTKDTWTVALRTMFRRPRFAPSASISSKQSEDRVSNLSRGSLALETSERLWAKSLLLPVGSRSDLTHHAAKPVKLATRAAGAGRIGTSEKRPYPDLKRGAWFSSPLHIERREHALSAILNASDLQMNGVALDSKAVAPQPNSPCKRTLFSQFQPLSLAQRSIEPQLAMVSHAQAAVELGRQSGPQIPVVFSVKAPRVYTPQIDRAGQVRRNAQFVPIVVEQQLEIAPVGMTASVSRLRLPGLAGRGFEPTLAAATYELYPETLSVANLRDAGGHSSGTSRSANPAIDSVRQGLVNPGFLPFDIEQPLMQQQTQPTPALRPAPNLTYIPLRDSSKDICLAAAAETWYDPIELCYPGLLTLESLPPASATNSTLPSSCILGPSDSSFSFGFKHLQVAAATSTWQDASPLEVPKVRLHEPFISLRGPSCRSLTSSESRPSRNDRPFKPAAFSYGEYGPGTVDQTRVRATPNIVTSDFTGDADLEILEVVVSTADEDFESTATLDSTEPPDTPARPLPGLFAASLQKRVCPMSFSLQRSHPRWLKWSATSTNDWMSDSVYRPPHNIPADGNFRSEELKQSGARAFGPFRMEMNAQPELQWSPCKTSTRR